MENSEILIPYPIWKGLNWWISWMYGIRSCISFQLYMKIRFYFRYPNVHTENKIKKNVNVFNLSLFVLCRAIVLLKFAVNLRLILLIHTWTNATCRHVGCFFCHVICIILQKSNWNQFVIFYLIPFELWFITLWLLIIGL